MLYSVSTRRSRCKGEPPTLGKQSIGIGVVQILRGAQAANEVISIAAIVRSTLDLGQMSHLMENSRSLILSVTGAAKSWKASEEERAVDHLTGRGVSVRQDTAGAGTKDVRAIVARISCGRRSTLCGDVVEDPLHSGDCRRCGGSIPLAFESLLI